MTLQFEIRKKIIHIPGSGYSDDSGTRTQYRLWLVLDAQHERHIDSSWNEIDMYDLADHIKNAAIEPAQEETS